MLANVPLYWWLLALAGLVIVAGVGVWHTKLVKLIRALRLENRGMRLLFAGYPGRAEILLLRSLRLAEAADGPEGSEVGPIVANLAQTKWFQEDYDEAERLYMRAIKIRENAVGPNDSLLPMVLGNLAQMLHSRGREDEAAMYEARAQEILEANTEESTLSPHSRGIFTSSGLIHEPPNWGEHMEAARAAEDDGEIEEHLMAALALAERQGSADPHLSEPLHELGMIHYTRGDFEGAESYFERAVSVREEAFGPENASVSTSLNNLAAVYRAQKRDAEALPLFERALAIIEADPQPNENELAAILENYAALLRETERTDEAEELEARAKAMRAKNVDQNLVQ